MLNYKNFRFYLLIFLLIAVLAAGIFIFKVFNDRRTVGDFEECAAAGYPVMESYPAQCNANGQIFVEKINLPAENPSELCVNLCGDRICQEVVCMGTGCPCPETSKTCPRDCQ